MLFRSWLAIRASGITAWGLLTAVVLWGILLRTRLLGRLASPMRLLDMHRWLGVVALLFLLVHIAFLLIDPTVKFTVSQILVPGLAPWKTFAVALGTIAFWTLIPVTFLGRLRPKLGKLGNTWFKRSHLLAYTAWPIATAHYVLAGTDALADIEAQRRAVLAAFRAQYRLEPDQAIIKMQGYPAATKLQVHPGGLPSLPEGVMPEFEAIER